MLTARKLGLKSQPCLVRPMRLSNTFRCSSYACALTRWCDREESRMETMSKTLKPESSDAKKMDSARVRVLATREFLKQVPMVLCANAAHTIQASARAVLYAESHLRQLRMQIGGVDGASTQQGGATMVRWCGPKDVQLMQRVYSGLMEPDGILGLSTLRQHSTLSERALDYESAGYWQESLQCNELLLQRDPHNARHQASVLTCMRNLGQFNLLHEYANAAMVSASNEMNEAHHQSLRDYAIQGAWRLSKWCSMTSKELDGLETFDANVARMLLNVKELVSAPESARGEVYNRMHGIAERTHAALLPALASASVESYERAYPYILQLHLLADIEAVARLCRTMSTTTTNNLAAFKTKVVDLLESRITLLEQNPQIREPLLAIQRTLYGILGLPEEVRRTWCAHAKLLRKADILPAALSAVMQACAEEPYGGLRFVLE
eukprot:PhF_6_TR7827/c0_g1_i6/m.11305/K06640/ATR; serine/threonine-protein kinase ATR